MAMHILLYVIDALLVLQQSTSQLVILKFIVKLESLNTMKNACFMFVGSLIKWPTPLDVKWALRRELLG